MVNPVGPSESSGVVPHSTQTPQQREKLFELQFNTAVIGDYIAVSGHSDNSPLQQQLAKLKGTLSAGANLDQSASDLNHLITQVNQTVVPGKATFPPFNFSSEGGSVQMITHFAITLEKFLNTAGEKGALNWPDEQKMFKQLASLINNAGQMTTEESYNNLNRIIDEANKALSPAYKLPKLAQK